MKTIRNFIGSALGLIMSAYSKVMVALFIGVAAVVVLSFLLEALITMVVVGLALLVTLSVGSTIGTLQKWVTP